MRRGEGRAGAAGHFADTRPSSLAAMEPPSPVGSEGGTGTSPPRQPAGDEGGEVRAEREGAGVAIRRARPPTPHLPPPQSFIFDYGDGGDVLGGPPGDPRGPPPPRRADAGFADVPGDPFDEDADVAPPPPPHTGVGLAARPTVG